MPNVLGEHRKDASTRTGKIIVRWVRPMRYNVLANLSVLVSLIIAYEDVIVKNYFQ